MDRLTYRVIKIGRQLTLYINDELVTTYRLGATEAGRLIGDQTGFIGNNGNDNSKRINLYSFTAGVATPGDALAIAEDLAEYGTTKPTFHLGQQEGFLSVGVGDTISQPIPLAQGGDTGVGYEIQSSSSVLADAFDLNSVSPTTGTIDGTIPSDLAPGNYVLVIVATDQADQKTYYSQELIVA